VGKQGRGVAAQIGEAEGDEVRTESPGRMAIDEFLHAFWIRSSKLRGMPPGGRRRGRRAGRGGEGGRVHWNRALKSTVLKRDCTNSSLRLMGDSLSSEIDFRLITGW